MTFKKKKIFLSLIIFLIFLCYSNSFHSSWHLDDYPNIILNNRLHLEKIDLSSILQTFHAHESGRLYRPVPMLSFALNWYFQGTNVLGYHIVNILIHCINSILLYLCIVEILSFPVFNNKYSNSDLHLISLIATLFWALNPIQTQAITYVVQRMTSMAAMFFMASLYLYLLSKRATYGFAKNLLITGSILAFFLASFSKENVVFLPFTIFLLEIIFFESIKLHRFKLKWQFTALVLAGVAFIILITFSVFEWHNPIEKLGTLYDQRNFTVLQRLMTESRVLVFYLSILFLPIPHRLSLCHDFSISTSIFSPITTVVSLIILILIITYCIINLQKKKVLCFSILFFFINHIVESTFLPLELVFEHRNYLPSIFIFFPLAVFIVQKKATLSTKSKRFNSLILALICLIIGVLCNWTFERNLVWLNEKSLWEYEIRKNPFISRPYHNLAWGYYQVNGQYEEALRLYKKALSLKANSMIEQARTNNNIGRIYYLMEDYENALISFRSTNELGQDLHIAYYQEAMTLIQLQRWHEASKLIDQLFLKKQFNLDLNKLKGIVLLHQGDFAGSVRYFDKSVRNNPTSSVSIVHLSIALSKMKLYDQASNLLLSHHGGDDFTNLLVPIGLAEINRLKGDEGTMQHYLDRIPDNPDDRNKPNLLETWSRDTLMPMIDYELYQEILFQG